MSNEINVFQEDNFAQAVKVAGTLAKSTIVPLHFRGKPEDVFACLVLGAELGFKPMQALNSIVMIQGNATLKAQTQMALCIGKVPGLKVVFEEDVANSIVSCQVTRGENSFKSIWDDVKAGAMGLLGKDNYKKQKMTMYRWRSCSEALKIICPDILMAIDSFEDMIDLDPPRLTMSQQLKKDLNEDHPIPEEEKIIGPNYRVQHGTTLGGHQLKEFDLLEIETYLEKLTNLKRKLPWQLDLCHVLTEYITNYEIYKEQSVEE